MSTKLPGSNSDPQFAKPDPPPSPPPAPTARVEVAVLPNIEHDKILAALEQTKRNADFLIEHYKVMAKIRRASFMAYVSAGFTEAQALELCAKP